MANLLDRLVTLCVWRAARLVKRSAWWTAVAKKLTHAANLIRD